MIRYLIKGILRDKNRSVIPVIIVTIGVMLTVTFSGYLRGMMGDIVDKSARFQTGHVKVMSRAYAENKDQLPNDLALLGVDTLIPSLERQFPDVQWMKRIYFGGLIDVPNENGETMAQGPATGLAIELHNEKSGELKRLNIEKSIVKGAVPAKAGEALVGYKLAKKLNLEVGDELTYIGATMNGSMTFENFAVSGMVRFGSENMDRGAFIIDIADAQRMLDMDNGTGEILGFFNTGVYKDERAKEIATTFNASYRDEESEFAPTMVRLKEQNNLASFLDLANSMSFIFVIVFVMAMSVVLWNTGLLGGLRRYQEFGIRLALGEEKRHVYKTLIYEAVIIGVIGSIIGTLIGLGITFYMQIVGVDITGMMPESNMMLPNTLRSEYTPDLLFIGFIPGLVAMVLGNMLSGRGIYKRETATLFKELEV